MEKITATPSRVKITAHLIGWLVFFIAPVILSPGRDMMAYFSEPGIFISLILRNLFLMLLFYGNLFYFTPKFFTTGRFSVFFIIVGLMILIIGTMNFFIHEILNGPFHEMGDRPPLPPENFSRRPPAGDFGPGPPHRLMLASPYFSSLLITLLVATASTLLVLWNNLMQAKVDEQERTLQKVAAELSMLRLQISPHFLFNTLNNIRWLVRSGSEQAEPALVKLSQLLRYVLYQTNAERVSLIKEVEHLQDYIELQKMRLPENTVVRFIITGNLHNQQIVPLLLIPLVENFFKHGDFKEHSDSRLELKVEGSQLNLITVNKILEKSSTENKDLEESGIGVENVKRRLALHYPGLHELKQEVENGYYFVRLGIILS